MTLGTEDCEKCPKDSHSTTSKMTVTCASGVILEADRLNIQDLPEVALLKVLLYCDVTSLGRLTQVNRYFKNLIDQNQIWRNVYQHCLFHGVNPAATCGCKRSMNGLHCVAHHNSCSCTLSVKDRYRMCRNWTKSNYAEFKLLKAVRQMPSIHLENGLLYRTDRNNVYRYRQKCNGLIQTSPVLAYRGLSDDVCRFIATGDRLIASSVKGTVISWSKSTGEVEYVYNTDHSAAITSLEAHQDLVYTGSRDTTVGMWRCSGEGLVRVERLMTGDRVLSLTLHDGRLATGTAGLNQVPALRLWDVDRGSVLCVLEDGVPRNGAGILDLNFLTSAQLLSCGYDNSIRLWDTRNNKCVRMWEDPFDVSVYCVRTLGAYSMVSGTAMYGMARVWDRRAAEPVQKYYVSKTTSPVYSLAYGPSYLYLALDKGIHMLDFTVK